MEMLQQDTLECMDTNETVPRLGKIFFVLSRAEHARMWRRVLRLQGFFESAHVAGFERVGVPVLHNHSYESLGKIAHRHFLARVPAYLKSARICIGHVAASDFCYAFSLDILIMLYVLKRITRSKTQLVYEVADIHPSLSARSLKGCLLRFIEKGMIRRACAVVMTSPEFRSGYFGTLQGLLDFPAVVIEHKVELPAEKRERIVFERVRRDVLVIGYVGLMKSVDSFELLIKIAEAGMGRVEIQFHGLFVPPLDVEECISRIFEGHNMEYCGPYRSPEDLENVYRSVDIVWDAYREGDNARWQRTTRFSESCFFKRPVVFEPQTPDGKLAERYGLGLSMSFNRPEKCVRDILSIDDECLHRWFDHFDSLPRSLIFYENEYEDLVKLMSLAEKTAKS